MNNIANKKFSLKPVVAALALATAAGSAYAAPTANQMPGAGVVVATSLGSAGTSQGGVGTLLNGLVSGGAIGIDGKVIIRWGGTGAPVDITNPVGFNLGSNATMYFGAISRELGGPEHRRQRQFVADLRQPGLDPGRDRSGWSARRLRRCAFAPAMFVSNANGIVVGAGARIVAPSGRRASSAPAWTTRRR